MDHLRISKVLRIVGRSGSKKMGTPTELPSNALQSEMTAHEITSQQVIACSDLPIEILQHIFSYLDFTAILKCRCVCSGWLHCVPGDSKDLRRVLFLPSPTTCVPFPACGCTLYVDIHTDAKSTYSRRRSAKVANICNIKQTVALLPSTAESTMSLHPFVQNMGQHVVSKIPSCIRENATSTLNFVSLQNKAGDLVQPEEFAFWKEMLVASPPVTDLYVKFRYVNRDEETIEPRDGHGQTLLSNDEGVKFVELFSVMEIQVMGLLRREALKRFDHSPQACIQFSGLRDRICDAVCPVE
jgi:hypothetical protein